MPDVTSPITFERGLGLFDVHFRGDPIVPGVLLVDEAWRRAGLASHRVRVATDVTFHAFARPGQALSCRTTQGVLVVHADDTRCCTLSTHGERDTLAPGDEGPTRSRRQPLAPAREPDYWFLPAHADIAEDGMSAACDVDIVAVLERHAYLRELPAPALLVAVEAAGNLALALQRQQDGDAPASSYVFARFGRLESSIADGAAPALRVTTRVQRFGSFVLWEASALDAQGAGVRIQNALSVKKRTA